MKSIDFTKPGGFPLTQDQLNYLQTAYTESLSAIAQMGASGTSPVKVSGMDVSSPGTGSYSVTSGWFYYNGHLVRFNASSVSGATGGSDAFVVLNTSSLPLVFYDGSTPNVVNEVSASLNVLPTSTPTDSTHFPLSTLKPIGVGLGVNNRESSWNSIAVSTAAADGGVAGTLYYKKDFIANTLHLRVQLIAANAQNFAASPGTLFYLMSTLPTEYTPANNVWFQQATM